MYYKIDCKTSLLLYLALGRVTMVWEVQRWWITLCGRSNCSLLPKLWQIKLVFTSQIVADQKGSYFPNYPHIIIHMIKDCYLFISKPNTTLTNLPAWKCSFQTCQDKKCWLAIQICYQTTTKGAGSFTVQTCLLVVLLRCECCNESKCMTADTSRLHIQVGRLNLFKEGDRTLYTQQLLHCTVPRCWEEVERDSNYHTRKAAVLQFNKSVTVVSFNLTSCLSLDKIKCFSHLWPMSQKIRFVKLFN